MSTIKKTFISFMICVVLGSLYYHFDATQLLIDYYVYHNIDINNVFRCTLHNADNVTIVESIGIKRFLSDVYDMKIQHNHHVEIIPSNIFWSFCKYINSSTEKTTFKFIIVGNEYVDSDCQVLSKQNLPNSSFSKENELLSTTSIFQLKSFKDPREITWKTVLNILVLSVANKYISNDRILQIKITYSEYYVVVETINEIFKLDV